MDFPEAEGTPSASRVHVAPPAHALLVAPAVGSVVAMLVVVGIAALTIGALYGFVSSRSRGRVGPGEPHD